MGNSLKTQQQEVFYHLFLLPVLQFSLCLVLYLGVYLGIGGEGIEVLMIYLIEVNI